MSSLKLQEKKIIFLNNKTEDSEEEEKDQAFPPHPTCPRNVVRVRKRNFRRICPETQIVTFRRICPRRSIVTYLRL